MAVNLGEGYIQILAKTDKFAEELESGTAPGLTAAEDEAAASGGRSGERFSQEVSKGASKGSSSLKGMLTNLGIPSALLGGWGAMGVAVAGVGAVAFDLGKKMQSADAQIAVSSGSSVKAAQAIGNAMLDTAGKSEFSGQTMAVAYASVAGQLKATEGAALSKGQAMTVMNAADTLATAQQISLGDATKSLSDIMTAYQLPVGQAANATNVMFNTSNMTGQSVDALDKTFTKIHGTLGVNAPSLKDTAGLLLDLQNNGEKGRQALTGLSSGLTAMVNPTTAQAKAMFGLGINLKDAQGNFIGIGPAMDELSNKLAVGTNAQDLQAASSVFGAKAAAQLLPTIMAASGGFDHATDSVSKHGAAQAAAAIQTHTLKSEFDTLKATAVDYGTKLGVIVVPAVSSLLRGVMILLPILITLAHWVVDLGMDFVHAGQFIADHKALLVAVGTAVATILIPVLATLAVSLGTAAASFVAEGVAAAAAWIATLGPIALIIAAIAAVAAGVYEVISHWSVIEAFFKKLLDDVVGFFTDHWKLILDILLGPIAIIATNWGKIEGFFQNIWDDVTKDVSKFVDGIVKFFEGLPDRILKALGNIGGKIGGAIQSGLHSIPVIGSFLAEGGQANIGQPYIVGEKGPELFVPGISGTVIPNSQLTSAMQQSGSMADLQKAGGATGSAATGVATQPMTSPLGGSTFGDVNFNMMGGSAQDAMTEFAWFLRTAPVRG